MFIAQLVKNLPAMQERPWFDPWVGKICWRRERLPTPVFWPWEFQGLYSPWGRKESDTTEQLSLSFFSFTIKQQEQDKVLIHMHMGNHHPSQDNEHIHCPPKFLASHCIPPMQPVCEVKSGHLGKIFIPKLQDWVWASHLSSLCLNFPIKVKRE